MKKFAVVFFASCLALSNAKAREDVSGVNFAVSHPTTISAIGAYDGGTSFASSETVAIFNELNGDLVGAEVAFGPGNSGTQVGNMFYEKVPAFVLAPGEYSLITIANGSFPSSGGSQLSSGGFLLNLDDNLDMPGGGRFGSSGSFDISFSELPGSGPGSIDLLDPKTNVVPDGGLTVLLLGSSLAVLRGLRRKL
jgi:hypothetical protein